MYICVDSSNEGSPIQDAFLPDIGDKGDICSHVSTSQPRGLAEIGDSRRSSGRQGCVHDERYITGLFHSE